MSLIRNLILYYLFRYYLPLLLSLCQITNGRELKLRLCLNNLLVRQTLASWLFGSCRSLYSHFCMKRARQVQAGLNSIWLQVAFARSDRFHPKRCRLDSWIPGDREVQTLKVFFKSLLPTEWMEVPSWNALYFTVSLRASYVSVSKVNE